MRLFKRKYRSQSQQAALAAFWFSAIFIVIVTMIIFTATIPNSDRKEDVKHQNVVLSEAIARMNK